jgi:hypothetical protein
MQSHFPQSQSMSRRSRSIFSSTILPLPAAKGNTSPRVRFAIDLSASSRSTSGCASISRGGDVFKVSGRGELAHRNLARKHAPRRIRNAGLAAAGHFHEEDGQKLEPFEEVIVDTPRISRSIIERLGYAQIRNERSQSARESVRLIFEGPTRGLLGYRNQFVLDTKGEGILSSRVVGFQPYAGEIKKRQVGSMISMASGKALGFRSGICRIAACSTLAPATEVYEGMVIGNTSKGEEMMVNPTKGKQLTNMRSKSSDEAINLVPPFELSIERGLEVMAEDEYLEIKTCSHLSSTKCCANAAQRPLLPANTYTRKQTGRMDVRRVVIRSFHQMRSLIPAQGGRALILHFRTPWRHIPIRVMACSAPRSHARAVVRTSATYSTTAPQIQASGTASTVFVSTLRRNKRNRPRHTRPIRFSGRVE